MRGSQSAELPKLQLMKIRMTRGAHHLHFSPRLLRRGTCDIVHGRAITPGHVPWRCS